MSPRAAGRPEAARRGARIVRVSGPVVVAQGLRAAMHETVFIGDDRLMGEVIRIDSASCTIQVYEDTTGIKPGEPVVATGRPLTVELGPGLLGGVFDGVERPLPALLEKQGAFIGRGLAATPLDRERKWAFTPSVKDGANVGAGAAIGYVEEFGGFKHRILVPPGIMGVVHGIRGGKYSVDEVLCEIIDEGTTRKRTPVRMMQSWPIRTPRPVTRKHLPDTPLITGQRVIDALFPIAKGGTAIVSGPFGAGKTVLQHQLAKWSDADIIVYVGCGERGNEMTQVIVEFPQLKDPRTGKPLLQRTVLVANTSNMPVAAREASIYTGVTIAEYFRDMGYHVALMADSTSRWAEALREISSRLGEMPGEEGFPAYLASRIAGFYERAGLVTPLCDTAVKSSLTIIGAVSPPGGDFFEPVTQASLRVAKVFWALDARLAQQRHFPSVNWLQAYSLYETQLQGWYGKNGGEGWPALSATIKSVLQEESRLLEIVRLVGSDALPDRQRWTLHVARLIREGFLQQEASAENETYCSIERMHRMVRCITRYHSAGLRAIDGKTAFDTLLSHQADHRIFALRHCSQEAFIAAADEADKAIAAIETETDGTGGGA